MKIKSKSKYIREFTPLIIVCLFAMIIVPISGVSITGNSAFFLSLANKILSGENPVTAGQRPLFLIILASGFKLLGKTVQSASLATRIFFALEIILIYLLGRVFYNKTVGFLSSGLVLTSYGINYIASYIDTDTVISFFILLFVLTYYISLTRSSRIFAVLAGISLGLGLLVKESSLFYLGLPFGMIIFAQKGKRRQYVRLGVWVFGTLVIFLVFLVILAFFYTGTFHTMFEGQGLFNMISGKMIAYDLTVKYWSHVFTIGFPNAVFKYYKNFLQNITPLSIFMIFGWFFLLIRGLIYKKTSDLILAILVISALPLILRLGDYSDRLGQTTIVYMFLYVALAAFFVSFIRLLIKYIAKFNSKYKKINAFIQPLKKHPKFIYYLLIILVGIFSVKAQLFTKDSRGTWKLWTESKYSLSVFSKKPFKVYDRFSTEQQEAAEWLKKNAPKKAKIIADGYANEAMDFFEVADYQIPFFHPTFDSRISPVAILERHDRVRPLYLITYSNFDSGSPGHRCIWPIYEANIIDSMQVKPDYLVISGRGLFFSSYFDKAKWVSLKFDNQLVRIYEIHFERFEPVPFENVGVNDSINGHLIWLEKNYPDEYSSLKKMLESAGLTVEELKNSPLRFPRGKVY